MKKSGQVYRQNPDGIWSHKRGRTAVIDTDASETEKIYDPSICAKNYGSGINYSIFVGYYAVSACTGTWWEE